MAFHWFCFAKRLFGNLFYTMFQLSGITWWKKIRTKVRQRREQKLLARQNKISKEGICLYARLEDFYETGRWISGRQLFRMKVCIQFLDETRLHVMTTTLVSGISPACRGKMIRFKILQGDLSHMVLII